MLFFIFAAALVVAALGVILARNPVYSALLLVLCFFNSAVIWLLLDAEFLGIVLVLVYVGAVMVLFLFVVMMLDVNLEELRKGLASYWPLAVAVAGFLVFAIDQRHRGEAPGRPGHAHRTGARPPIIPIPANWARRCSPAMPIRRRSPRVILLVASVAAIVLTLRQPHGRQAAEHRHAGRGARQGSGSNRQDGLREKTMITLT